MKKSKIIVPALGIILLSTVASVTGTVAWFTANTKYDTKVSKFEIARLQGDLSCELAQLKNTTVTGTYDENNPSAQSVSVTNNNKMTDASFDHVSGKVYQPQVRTSSLGENFAAVNDSWSTTSGTSTFYYAVSWTMTFKYRLPSVVTDTYLYLDGSLSQIAQVAESTVTNSDAAQDSKQAFRLMFTQGEGANINYVLWAPERDMSSSRVEYIQDNADTTGDSDDGKRADYGASFKIVHAGNKASLTETAAVSTGANAIGQIAKTTDTPNSQVTLPVTCTAWFEGCDSSVVNLTKMYAIVASLSFFVK